MFFAILGHANLSLCLKKNEIKFIPNALCKYLCCSKYTHHLYFIYLWTRNFNWIEEKSGRHLSYSIPFQVLVWGVTSLMVLSVEVVLLEQKKKMLYFLHTSKWSSWHCIVYIVPFKIVSGEFFIRSCFFSRTETDTRKVFCIVIEATWFWCRSAAHLPDQRPTKHC